MLNIKLKGAAELKKALGKIRFEEAAERAVAETVLSLEQKIKLGYQRGPASGRTYQKYNPRRLHRASAPGEAPATDTGRLVGSVNSDIGGLIGSVGSPLAYASYLEFGTQRIAPRPLWVPLVEEEGKLFVQRLQENIKADIA